MNNIAYGLIMQELEAGDSGLTRPPRCRACRRCTRSRRRGSEAQKRCYLPEMAKGKLIGCFGLN